MEVYWKGKIMSSSTLHVEGYFSLSVSYLAFCLQGISKQEWVLVSERFKLEPSNHFLSGLSLTELHSYKWDDIGLTVLLWELCYGVHREGQAWWLVHLGPWSMNSQLFLLVRSVRMEASTPCEDCLTGWPYLTTSVEIFLLSSKLPDFVHSLILLTSFLSVSSFASTYAKVTHTNNLVAFMLTMSKIDIHLIFPKFHPVNLFLNAWRNYHLISIKR